MIRNYKISELAAILGGTYSGDDIAITGISIDSRKLQAGDLFIAIRGTKFDGHTYLDNAIAAGAAAVLIQEPFPNDTVPHIFVEDTKKALGRLGQFNRAGFNQPLLAITGTCGKTSVKEMLASVLTEEGKIITTNGNLNNTLGVPLTLFRLEEIHRFGVIELGTSSAGEIDYITKLTIPDVSIITNAAENHLKHLLSLEGVIYEKGFILDGLQEFGVAVLNFDDPSFQKWQQRALQQPERKILSFSLENNAANCFASRIQTTDQGMSFKLHVNRNGFEQSASVNMAFWGRHQISNACCTAAAAIAVNLKLENIVRGLENARPYPQRGTRYQISSHVLVIDESYNASPIATIAAINQLAESSGKTIMVLGDMLDLGDVSDIKHMDIGNYAYKKNIHYFAGYGQASALAVKMFGHGGYHFTNQQTLLQWIQKIVNQCYLNDANELVTILVKGSWSMKMLDVVRYLVGSEYQGER